MKYLFLFFCVSFFAQTKIFEIRDEENNQPIFAARINIDGLIYYTNDDGKVILPVDKKALITAKNFDDVNIYLSQQNNGIIKLVLKYNEIEEIILRPIKVKPIFENLLKYYNKYYGVEPTIYGIQMKQKAKESNNLNNLFVSDLNLWVYDGEYHFNSKLYSFAQMSINKVEYYQTRKNDIDYRFNNDLNIKPEQFIQKLFFNSQIAGIVNDFKDIKINANIVFEDKNKKKIKFHTALNEKYGYDCEGEFILSNEDNMIVYFELYINQAKTISQKVNRKKEKYLTKTNFVSLIYDFYKKDGKYIPTRYEAKGSGVNIYKGEETPFDFSQEIIYKSTTKGDKKGLENKIDLSKPLTDNIPINEIKDTKTLLSTEEQKFVDEP